jgi:uncharacterized protein YecT (DUF1311 family)
MITRTLSLVALLALTACDKPATPPAKVPEPSASVAPAPTPPAVQPQVSIPPTAAPEPTTAEIEARYTPHYDHCLNTGDAAEGVTPAMAGCVVEELSLQDGALNAEYQRVMRLLAEPQRTALRDAQRQWIADRDQSCAEAANSGGTIDMIERPACHLSETVKRTIELERMGVR